MLALLCSIKMLNSFFQLHLFVPLNIKWKGLNVPLNAFKGAFQFAELSETNVNKYENFHNIS